jgi:hypothetical protein
LKKRGVIEMSVEKILEGAYDLHVHSAPDIIKRKLDDVDMVERLRASKIKGYAIKSHVSSTTGRAKLINKLYPDVDLIGTISLNNAVGGLNPFAVEVAARDGAKLVWLPTIDSVNEQEHIDKIANTNPEKLPFFAKFRMELKEKGKLQDPIYILDGDSLKKAVYDIIETAIEYDLSIATGHISTKEVFVLAKEAKKAGFKKLIITHPEFPSTSMTKEEQKELADMGAILEHCFTTPYTNKITWEEVYEQIRYVGPEHCIISTDLGQPAYVYPDEGMKIFAENLLNNGFSENEIKIMTCENTKYLISR